MGLCGVAMGALLGRGDSPGMLRGVDRDADGLFGTLLRRLAFDAVFLRREAGIDGATRSRVLLEALHAEVLRTRLDAALAGFVGDALLGAKELPTLFTEGMRRALGVSPPPSWAVVLVAQALEPAAPWGGAWTTSAAGARLEPLAREWLRERFNEDWFRNPHAGDGIAAMARELQAFGTEAWARDGRDARAMALAHRFDDAHRDLRR